MVCQTGLIPLAHLGCLLKLLSISSKLIRVTVFERIWNHFLLSSALCLRELTDSGVTWYIFSMSDPHAMITFSSPNVVLFGCGERTNITYFA